MNRKLIAVAVAGAMGLPALAVAQSTVQIYGRAHVEYSWTDSGGINEDQMHNGGGSNIGLRGTESLGGGLSAWFQCESSVQVQSGANGDGFCTRNSAVGLRGGFGNVHFGNWDMPMKWATISGVKLADTGTLGVANLFHKGAPANIANGVTPTDGVNVTIIAGATISRNTATSNTALMTFYRRNANTVQYWTPNFGGFEGRIGISAANEETAANGLTPRTISLAGKYASGPLLLAAGYEKHQDYALAGRDDTGWILAASYQFGPVRLAAMYEDLKWESLHATNSGDTSTWGLFAEWRISGPHTLKAQFVQADDTKGSLTAGNVGAPGQSLNAAGEISVGTATNMVFNGGAGGTGADQWGLGYQYDFSKRTALKLNYTYIDNDSNARYGAYNAGSSTALRGESVSAFGVAIDHRF